MKSLYTHRNFLIVLSAPSGGGKSTLKNAILRKFENIEYSVSYTTRNPRGNEQNEVDYFFVSNELFGRMIQNNEFLEYAQVHGNWYGTSRAYIESRFKKGNHVIMDVDVQGAANIRKNGIDKIDIFIMPPDIKILEQRLRDRNTDIDEVISQRLKNARAEIKEIYKYDYLVINDNLDVAIEEISAIIKAEENKTIRYCNAEEKFIGE